MLREIFQMPITMDWRDTSLIGNGAQEARLLGDACRSFTVRCVNGIEADRARIATLAGRSLILVTALSPQLGYARAAEIAQKAHAEGLTLREATLALGYLDAATFDRLVDPALMLGPDTRAS